MKDKGKTLVFTSDMYLPKDAIELMLEKIGFNGYSKFYLSNEHRLRKGDGTLQKVLLEDFPGQQIIHVGDSEVGDVHKSIEAGIKAIHNPSSHLKHREPDMDNLAGSFYRAIIQHTLNNGTWDESLHYEHGFRVGGILATGFCQYLNNLAQAKQVDKILFCARDCKILWNIYNQTFNEFENEYIEVSRYALMNVAHEKYLYDLINRSIMRCAEEARSSKTIEAILNETGFGYLVDYLEDDDIDKFLFPQSLDKKKLEKFIFNHRNVIAEYNQPAVEAAKKYFEKVIGNARNILIVDIGWSGTCVTVLKYFLEKHFPEKNLCILGALMCTSRGNALTCSVSWGTIVSYVYSPFHNMDLTRFMMPAKTPARQQDLLHMPLEYLFTSTAKSLVRYAEDKKGNIVFERTKFEPTNPKEIIEMQQGMLDFAQTYKTYTKNYEKNFSISPYVAFNPLRDAIKYSRYSYEVYKNFKYDATVPVFSDTDTIRLFGELFNHASEVLPAGIDGRKEKRILFVTPELIYAGAPRSLLRMCKVAAAAGYQPIVWSSKPGPFAIEFKNHNIPIRIVTEKDLSEQYVADLLETFDFAICNTIVTDKYVKTFEGKLPLLWYIREATNIPDFCKNNPERLRTLQNSESLCCVSDYAAAAISKYTPHKVKVIRNSVEDERTFAIPYVPGSQAKVKFVQFGTIEYRKGYDVLLAAYEALPQSYKQKSELYFAGGFINSGTPYCSYLFSKIENEQNVHYLGVVKGEKNKIETLSQMDVVVVASRDESCSLVALEGAMLSKPLIVTENVGAKYMVHDDNGLIVKTGDVEELKVALMKMVDNKLNLVEMGAASYKYYEAYASMDSYERELKELFEELENKRNNMRLSSDKGGKITSIRKKNNFEKKSEAYSALENNEVIVSMTSHPGRISTVSKCVESLLCQTKMPNQLILWLAKKQFPHMENDLPEDLLLLKQNKRFAIRWTSDDLAPHKKYFYAMQEFRDLPIITVDDDVIYTNDLIEILMKSYSKYPDVISCMRANLIMFRPDGRVRAYENWLMEYRVLLDTPSYQLLPTGVGGVLYPPHAIPEIAFNKEAIKKSCLFCDDLWLKVMSTHNGYQTLVPTEFRRYADIPGSQDVALWKKMCMAKIMMCHYRISWHFMTSILHHQNFC